MIPRILPILALTLFTTAAFAQQPQSTPPTAEQRGLSADDHKALQAKLTAAEKERDEAKAQVTKLQQPQSTPPTKADQEYEQSWQTWVNIAQQRAIEGPNELKAAIAAAKARDAWIAEQRGLIDADHKALQAKLTVTEKERDEAKAEVTKLQHQLAFDHPPTRMIVPPRKE